MYQLVVIGQNTQSPPIKCAGVSLDLGSVSVFSSFRPMAGTATAERTGSEIAQRSILIGTPSMLYVAQPQQAFSFCDGSPLIGRRIALSTKPMKLLKSCSVKLPSGNKPPLCDRIRPVVPRIFVKACYYSFFWFERRWSAARRNKRRRSPDCRHNGRQFTIGPTTLGGSRILSYLEKAGYGPGTFGPMPGWVAAMQQVAITRGRKSSACRNKNKEGAIACAGASLSTRHDP